MVMTETVGLRVIKCARCSGNHDVSFQKFKKPMTIGALTFTHFGLCPVTNEPIMMYFGIDYGRDDQCHDHKN